MNAGKPQAATGRTVLRAWRRLALVLGAALLATGCATVEHPNPKDPFESFNRSVYQFNDTVDRAVLKPVATGYQAVVPGPVRTCVSNIFSNVGQLWSAANSALQGKGEECANTLMRVAVNTTFGLGGCLDIASEVPGLEQRNEDLGQTLGKWGVAPGPYLVLPFFGPSTVRDAAGTGADLMVDPVDNLDHVRTRNSLNALRFVSRRAELLDASRILEGAAIDPYSFLRDAYLQRRLNLVYDGDPPDTAPPDDYYDPEAPEAPTAP